MVTRSDPARHEHEWRAADFVGGHPALDFLNTVADTGKTRDEEKLVDWPAVRAWAAKAGLLAQASRAMWTPRANGWHRSWVPWMTRTGHVIAASSRSTAARSSPIFTTL